MCRKPCVTASPVRSGPVIIINIRIHFQRFFGIYLYFVFVYLFICSRVGLWVVFRFPFSVFGFRFSNRQRQRQRETEGRERQKGKGRKSSHRVDLSNNIQKGFDSFNALSSSFFLSFCRSTSVSDQPVTSSLTRIMRGGGGGVGEGKESRGLPLSSLSSSSSSSGASAEPESVTWESVKWKDGSSYEGLIKDGNCHIRGVLRYANGDR